MFIKIYKELVLIRKGLQAIRSSMESDSGITLDGKAISQAVRKSIYGIFPEDVDTF